MFLKESQEHHEWLGLVVAFLGALMLVIGPEILNHTPGISLVGNLLIVAALVANMIYFLLAKRHYRQLPKFLVTTLSFYLGLLTFLGLSLIEIGGSATELVLALGHDLQHTSVWVASGYMALFGSIIGLTAYIKGQDGIEASEASLFYYLQPLVYIPLAFVLLGETISPTQIAGLVLVLIGVVVAEKRWKK
jgi:drug/metabolite transporter (DMT)-like permease